MHETAAFIIGLLLFIACASGIRAADPPGGAGGPSPSGVYKAVLWPDQTLTDLRAYLLRHIPAFIPPSNAGEWVPRADALRQRVLDQVVFRGIPESWRSGQPEVIWGETLPGKGYIIRKLRYEAVPGLWIGALLYEPTELKGKVPAVLNTNGHVGEPGMTIDYKQARCINLAKRGMLALNLEWIRMGQLRGAGYGHNDLAYLDLCGQAGLAVFYLCLERGLDVLCDHPAADLDRIAVTGLSGGGWQTILISALDTRVKLAAPNAGYIGLEKRIWNEGDIGDREQNATDLVAVADYTFLTGLLYPRAALLIYNVKDDCCFAAERARASVYEPVAGLYRIMQRDDYFAFHVNHDPGTHNYDLDNRRAFYRFLNHHFLPQDQRQDDEIPVDDEIRKPEELAIEYPDNNANFHTLAAQAMKPLPRNKLPAGDEAEIARWGEETREQLRRIVRPDPVPTEKPVEIALSIIPDTVDGAPGFAHHLRIRDQWTLPIVEFAKKDSKSEADYLILADGGLTDAREIVSDILADNKRAIVAQVLFTGECTPHKKAAWKYAQMVSTVGQRCLGIQVSQLDVLIDHVRGDPAHRPLHLITKGRVSGLAALVATALRPDRVEQLELRDMDASLKDLLVKKIPYRDAPSMFCFGLLELADVEDLIALAEPTPVELVPPAER